VSTEAVKPPTHCVMIPFLNRLDQVASCLNTLLLQARTDTIFLLIDDGSIPHACDSAVLQPLLSLPHVHLIQHANNQGVAAARNSGLHWCRKNNINIVIMMDSDCVPSNNVIDEHLRLHGEHAEAACIGARIVGSGMMAGKNNFWEKLDGITSWVHASPHQKKDCHEFRRVEHPYHLPTTNFSVKSSALPRRDFIFDERLKTGEDCLLVREWRRHQQAAYFSSTPTVYHQDRKTMRDVFAHHYEWGHHQYFIQLGGDISPRCFNPAYRILFVCVFLPLSPLFALTGALLNCKPLLLGNTRNLIFFPLIYLLWFGKAIAVLEAAIKPQACLRQARTRIVYEEVCGMKE